MGVLEFLVAPRVVNWSLLYFLWFFLRHSISDSARDILDRWIDYLHPASIRSRLPHDFGSLPHFSQHSHKAKATRYCCDERRPHMIFLSPKLLHSRSFNEWELVLHNFDFFFSGELSAYSVFNPNQEKITGTFDDKDMVPLVLVSWVSARANQYGAEKNEIFGPWAASKFAHRQTELNGGTRFDRFLHVVAQANSS